MTRKYGGSVDYFCKGWGCGFPRCICWMPPVTTDLITLHQEPGSVPANPNIPHPEPTPNLCNPVRIAFTDQGKNAAGWDTGTMWGVRVHGGVGIGIVLIGTLFTLQLVATVPTPFSRRAKSPRLRAQRDAGPAYTAPSPTEAPAGHSIALPALATLVSDPFFRLLEASYQAPSATRPNLT